jgi:hypothetical protein
LTASSVKGRCGVLESLELPEINLSTIATSLLHVLRCEDDSYTGLALPLDFSSVQLTLCSPERGGDETISPAWGALLEEFGEGNTDHQAHYEEEA